MNIHKLTSLALMIFAFNSVARASEMCEEKDLESVLAKSVECYFYSGTANFRVKNYQAAAVNWTALINLKSVPVELEYLRLDAYNNLGFLYFMGDGVKQNQKLALKYWNNATKAGHEESAYHLCHAYGESKTATYNPKLALGVCKEALRRYNQRIQNEEDSAEIIRQINVYISELEPN